MGSVLLVFLVFWFFQVKPKKQKKQNGRTYVPVSGMGSVLLVFLVFPGKTKKTKWQNLCPSVWHGVSTFGFLVFLVFPGKTKKTKKKQNGRTYVPVSGMGSVLLFFWFFQVKPKKQQKTKWQNLCPSVWHGVSTFGFLFFFGFSR